MNTDDFLKQFVDGYLFSDLQKMSEINLDVTKGEVYGAAGYSMLSSAIAGMELLGWLISGNSKNNQESGLDDFLFFWDNFLAKTTNLYNSKGKLVYQLVRNGLAHTYLAKPGVYVTKVDPSTHMTIDSAEPLIIINVIEFLKHFKQAYLNWKNEITQNQQKIDHSLNILLVKYNKDSEKYFGEYFKNNASANTSLAKTVGSPAVYISNLYRTKISNASTSPIPMSSSSFSASPISINVNQKNRNI